jgi:uncharacterized protein YbjT (DUF2867 family)
MVAPEDLGRVAAGLLQEPVRQTVIHPVEGPERYSLNDVAAYFAAALGRAVRVDVTHAKPGKTHTAVSASPTQRHTHIQG